LIYYLLTESKCPKIHRPKHKSTNTTDGKVIEQLI